MCTTYSSLKLLTHIAVLLINVDINHNILDAVTLSTIITVHIKINATGEVKFALIVYNVGMSLVMFSMA